MSINYKGTAESDLGKRGECVCGAKLTTKHKQRNEKDTHEAIAATFARLSVCDDDRFFDVAELLEEFPQRLVGRVVGQAADEDLRVRRVLLLQRGHGACGRQRAAVRRECVRAVPG